MKILPFHFACQFVIIGTASGKTLVGPEFFFGRMLALKPDSMKVFMGFWPIPRPIPNKRLEELNNFFKVFILGEIHDRIHQEVIHRIRSDSSFKKMVGGTKWKIELLENPSFSTDLEDICIRSPFRPHAMSYRAYHPDVRVKRPGMVSLVEIAGFVDRITESVMVAGCIDQTPVIPEQSVALEDLDHSILKEEKTETHLKFEKATGLTLNRETKGVSPSGNPFDGRWVLRDKDGVYIDHDQYRHDVIERHSK